MLNKHLFNRRTNGWRDGWTDGRTDGWMDRWIVEETDGQTEGRMDRQIGPSEMLFMCHFLADRE